MKRMASVNTFLVEIIIVILFFSLCVGITLQLFVTAHQENSLNSDMNMALVMVQTKAEEFKGTKSNADLDKLYQNVKTSSQENAVEGNVIAYNFYYDEHWKETSDSPKYTIEVLLSREQKLHGELVSAQIDAKKVTTSKDISLCGVQTKNYMK